MNLHALDIVFGSCFIDLKCIICVLEVKLLVVTCYYFGSLFVPKTKTNKGIAHALYFGRLLAYRYSGVCPH